MGNDKLKNTAQWIILQIILTVFIGIQRNKDGGTYVYYCTVFHQFYHEVCSSIKSEKIKVAEKEIRC